MPQTVSDHIYMKMCRMPSDINQHLEILSNYSTQCQAIAELGVRDCISTWAFINGLKDNNSEIKVLYSIDILDVPDIEFVINQAQDAGIDMKFFKESSLSVQIPTEIDMVFIDTWHIYAQLKRELQRYAPVTRKYIIMHDTEVDKMTGEAVRLGCDISELSKESGFPEEEISKGLGPAIVEFVNENSDTWRFKEHYSNNNGLTILERITNTS